MFECLEGASQVGKKAVDQAFSKPVKAMGSAVDNETAKTLKEHAAKAFVQARGIVGNLSDLNGNGKVDVEDLKFAAEKAGIAWDKIDPDLKKALVAGGVAGTGGNFVPLVGQAIAIPTFAGTTANLFWSQS